MKPKMIRFLLAAMLVTITSGCMSPYNSIDEKEVLFQYSTLGSLMEGVYDGDMAYSTLGEYGDFGLGTFNELDGEMIAIDHEIYQIKADGIAYQVSDEWKAPFAVVTYFEPDQIATLAEPMDCVALKAYIDSLLPTENIPYAIKVEGLFSYMKTRSVPRQDKPYLPLWRS